MKTLVVASFPSNNSISIPHGLTNLKQIIDVRASLYTSDGGVRTFPNPNSACGIEADGTDNIYISSAAYYSQFSGIVYIFYTKTV